MTRRDGNHEVAKIIKGLEQRISDLEEQDRSASTPNLLRTARDRVVVDDSGTVVTEHALETATWNSSTSGYRTSTYGAYE